ncbi:uncharacterized protein LOC144288669 isoform X7 [Canis aureus]
MWSNSFILETRKLESEKYEKNLESRITESEGLWKVIQVQRRELCWQNKVHGAKVWMKCIWTPQKSVPLPDLWPELCSVPYIPIKKTQRGAHLHASVSVVTYLGRATHGFENSSQERGMSQPAHGPSEFLTHLSTRTCFQSLRRFILHLVGEAPAMGVGYSGWAVREQDRLKDCPALYHRVPA